MTVRIRLPRQGLWLLGLAALGGCAVPHGPWHSTFVEVNPPVTDVPATDSPVISVPLTSAPAPHSPSRALAANPSIPEYSAAALARMSPQTPRHAIATVPDSPQPEAPKFATPEVRLASHLKGPTLAAPELEPLTPPSFEPPQKTALVPALPVSGQPTPAEPAPRPPASGPPVRQSHVVAPAAPAAAPLTLEAIQELALQYNPTIRQLSASAEEASGFREQVGLPANPTVGYNAMQLADEGTDQHTVFIERQFVTADKLNLNRNVLGHAVEAWKWDVEAQRHRVRTDVRLRFLEALAAQQRLEEIDTFLEVARKGADLAQRRFEAQETSQADLLQAQIQLNEAEIMRQQAQFTWDAAWQAMTASAGVPDLPRTTLSGSLETTEGPLAWDEVYAGLLANSPELQAAHRRVSQARSNLSRQEIQAIPNLITSLEAGHDNGTDSGMINVSVGAPIPVFNANQGNVSAAYAAYCRATHEVKRTELALRNRLADVARQYDSARVAVTQYDQQVLPKARQTLDLAEQAYAAGEYSFLQVLVVRRTFFDAQLRALEARQQLAQAHAQIDGLLLTGGLDEPAELEVDDSLRGLTLGQE